MLGRCVNHHALGFKTVPQGSEKKTCCVTVVGTILSVAWCWSLSGTGI